MWITRFVVVLAFLALGLVVSPAPLTSKWKHASGLSGATTWSDGLGGRVVALKLAYLLSFATAWGASLWVTFIGGIIMFRHMPRHQFGNLQSKLFPVYFRLVAVCAAACVASFATLHPWSSATSRERMQIVSLVLSLTSTLLNLIIFEPLTIKIMKERHKVEREESIGSEVGVSKNLEAAKRNPQLAKINKKFGKVHGLSSLSNLLSFGGFAIHSWYLASRLTL
ncbi:hypothetical protein O6H91_18G075800 [Diphasiastrum complanatum]|uniref:Uncharacterized protein n=1 Tax=Diphasiastrum complanatum TaxID=34168 RepID=A0ACC2B2U8_DIPCM|nr:hypothetical protein O6H91_Y383500 [Diphasiastrum complanatum]KAJ7524060.1 hypothetical protein O6H91_18G075800 [Diphasiastrum complanatum]